MSLNLIKSHLPADRREAIKRYLQNSRHRRLQRAVDGMFFGSDLRAPAGLYGSDEGSHEYVDHYHETLAPLRRKKIVFLEIAIGGYGSPEYGGASLRMWRTYFPNGRIYGIDIHDKSPHDEARIKTFRGSQADQIFLDRVLGEIGQPDVIIDDGSQVCAHIVQTFNILFPRLRDGGFYFVEDTQTSYWPDYGGSDSEPDDPRTTVGFFKQMIHGLNHAERQNPKEPTYFEKKIISITFFHNLIGIKKGTNLEGTGNGKSGAASP